MDTDLGVAERLTREGIESEDSRRFDVPEAPVENLTLGDGPGPVDKQRLIDPKWGPQRQDTRRHRCRQRQNQYETDTAHGCQNWS